MCTASDAWVDPSCGNWAAGVDKMYSSLGMQSPFLGPAGVGAVDPLVFLLLWPLLFERQSTVAGVTVTLSGQPEEVEHYNYHNHRASKGQC